MSLNKTLWRRLWSVAMFGELPVLFSDEDKLRQLRSYPDARKALMGRRSEWGDDALILMQVKKALQAQDRDINDVLIHISY